MSGNVSRKRFHDLKLEEPRIPTRTANSVWECVWGAALRCHSQGTKDSSYTAADEVTEGYTWCGDGSGDFLNSPVVEVTFVNGKVDIVQPYNIPAN